MNGQKELPPFSAAYRELGKLKQQKYDYEEVMRLRRENAVLVTVVCELVKQAGGTARIYDEVFTRAESSSCLDYSSIEVEHQPADMSYRISVKGLA